MRRFVILAVVAGMVAVAGTAWLFSGRAEPATKYRLARLEVGPIVSAVTATGTVNAVLTVQVGSQLSGQLRELLADFNSRVKTGDVIARLDADHLEARLKQAEADVLSARATLAERQAQAVRSRADIANAKAQTQRAEVAMVDGQREHKRQHDLLGRGVAATANADRAETAFLTARAGLAAARAQEEAAVASWRVAEAQVDAARANLAQREAGVRLVEVDIDRSIIRSPIDGVVVLRNVDVGQTVAASLQSPILFTIAQDLRQMEVHTNVDEADIGRVRDGQPVTFTVNAHPNDTFVGRVSQIRLSPQIIQNVVTYNVIVSAENPELKLLPGMTANVRIVTDRRDSALKLPNAALRYRPPGVTAAGSGGGPGPAAATSPGGGPAQGPGALDAFAKTVAERLQLTAEQQQSLSAIVEDTRRQFGALQRAELAPDERRNRAQGIRQVMGRRINEMLTAEQRPKFAELRQERAAAGPMRTIWVVGTDSQPQALSVRTGIGDGAFTEVSGESLRAGLEVIVGGGRAPTQPPRLGF